MDYFTQQNFTPRKILNFSNYFNRDKNVCALKSQIANGQISSLVISGNSGSGVTHLLNAICNELVNQNKKVMYITSQWMMYLTKKLKTESDKEKIINHFKSFDAIAIDNIQFLYRKTKRHTKFIFDAIRHFVSSSKLVLLGCSDPNKDVSKSNKMMDDILLKRIDLCELSSHDVFQVMKSLCVREDNIPDQLIYDISGYNGTIQQQINCLISIRFKSKVQNIKLNALSLGEIDVLFEISKYFPKQQFRRCFIQTELGFGVKLENKKVIILI